MNKPQNKWSIEFERLLEERQWSCNKAVTIMHSFQIFSGLHRATIYRWQSCAEEKIPPRAWKMLNLIQATPKANIFAEAMQNWIEKMDNIDEQLRIMRIQIKDMTSQIAFMKENQID